MFGNVCQCGCSDISVLLDFSTFQRPTHILNWQSQWKALSRPGNQFSLKAIKCRHKLNNKGKENTTSVRDIMQYL